MSLTAQPKAIANFLLAAGLVLGLVFSNGAGTANAQSIVLDFRFDTNGGANPSTFGSSSVNLAPGSAGQTYTVDIWATVFNGTPQASATEAPSNFGLQSIAMRGASNIVGAGAFSTGAGIGVVAGSFIELAPFNPAGFAQPQVSDIGKTTNGGLTVTSGADGILDFGGTIAAQRLTIASNTGGPQYGSGPSDVSSYSWEVGTFRITIGTAGTAAGAVTQFVPTILTSGQGAATADAYTAHGGAATTGPTTLSSNPLTFIVAQAAGTTISVTPGPNASVLKGGSVGLSAAINNTGSVALAAGDYNFAASASSATITFTSMPSVPIAAGASANFSTTAGTQSGPGGTPIGNATVTFTATGNGSTITNSPQSGTLTLNVGGATANNSNAAGVYGPALTAPVSPGGSYAGLESAVVAVTGSGGSNASNNTSPYLGGRAVILAGINNDAGTAKTVAMAWRTRLVPSESPGSRPPLPAGTTTGLSSDVVNLTGLEISGNTTDPYVLDMSYNPAFLPKGGPPAIEQSLANNKLIYMVSPTAADGSPYVNTVALNSGNTVNSTDARYGFQGSYQAFVGAFGPGLASNMGAWGVDVSSHEVWAVLNHNSTFAVVPEPSTILLAGLGLLGLVGLRRRIKKVA